jgi:hypothetical protein
MAFGKPFHHCSEERVASEPVALRNQQQPSVVGPQRCKCRE